MEKQESKKPLSNFPTATTTTKYIQLWDTDSEGKAILIDGTQLAELMFDYNVGVSTESTYVVKRVDSDFFEDDLASEQASVAAK
jgi:restriction system protein